VADAALQTATLRICALLADDKTTRLQTLEALSPALGAALAVEPAAFASRWCGGEEAAARFPTWVASSVRALVGGTVAEIHREGWAGGAGEQSFLLFCLLATVICTPPAREQPGVSGIAIATHAAAAVDGGARNAAANAAALLRHVSGNDAAVPPALRACCMHRHTRRCRDGAAKGAAPQHLCGRLHRGAREARGGNRTMSLLGLVSALSAAVAPHCSASA
jgi:hypothetical protein